METSIFLAKVLGLFGAIATLAIMLQYKKQVILEMEAAKNTATVVLSGYVFLLLGIMLVVSHNIWVKDWRVIITILAWTTLLKGALRIFRPEWVQNLLARKSLNKKFILAELVVFVISLYLIYQGFFVY